jgi:hypothetical protein
MTNDLPSLTYQEEFVFTGALRKKNAEFPIDGLMVVYKKYRYPSQITFTFQYPEDKRDAVMWFIGRRSVEFEGWWVSHDNAFIVRRPPARLLLRMTSGTAGRILGRVEEMEFGDFELEAVPETQTVTVWLTPSGIPFSENLRQVRFSNGEAFPYGDIDVRPPFEVPTRYGSFSLVLGREGERADVGGVSAEVTIPSDAMYLTVAAEHKTKNVVELTRSLSTEVQDLELMLSFLSRRQVRCYRVSVFSIAEQQAAISTTERYVEAYSTRQATRELVDRRKMQPDALKTVLEEFATSPYREPIQHAISFLLGYWDSYYAENEIAAAFTAMETIVNGISEVDGESKILPDEIFENLTKDVRKAIKEFAKANGLDATTRARLYEKVGELQRPAITPRTTGLMEKYGVEWRDLWPVRTGGEPKLQSELSSAYERRSGLIHRGRVDEELLADAASVHALAERLVFKLIGGRDEWVNYFAYWYAARRGPRPLP